MAKKNKFYAVAHGRKVGIFNTWAECEKQVKGYSGAIYKSFTTSQQAETFVNQNGGVQKMIPSTAADKSTAISRKRSAPKEEKHDKENPNTLAVTKRAKDSLAANEIEFRISFDGGSRGNPGIAGCGAELVRRIRKREPSSQKEIVERTSTRLYRFLKGSQTNNQAEYWGLVTGLERLDAEIRDETQDSSSDIQSIRVIVQGDSNLIVQQMKGNFKVGAELHGIHEVAKEKLRKIDQLCHLNGLKLRLTLGHVYRNENKIADECANMAMDAKRSWLVHKDNNGEESRSELDDANPMIRKRG